RAQALGRAGVVLHGEGVVEAQLVAERQLPPELRVAIGWRHAGLAPDMAHVREFHRGSLLSPPRRGVRCALCYTRPRPRSPCPGGTASRAAASKYPWETRACGVARSSWESFSRCAAPRARPRPRRPPRPRPGRARPPPVAG